MLIKDNVYEFIPKPSPYKSPKDAIVEKMSRGRSIEYHKVHEKLDSLEDTLTSKMDIIIETVYRPRTIFLPSFNKKHIFSLLGSTLITGGAGIALLLSLLGKLSPGWLFWASLTAASGGIMIGSLIVLLGVDGEKYY